MPIPAGPPVLLFELEGPVAVLTLNPPRAWQFAQP